MRYGTQVENFTRLAIAKSLGGSNPESVVEVARSRWGRGASVVDFIKASVGGVESADVEPAVTADTVSFIDLVREASVLRTGAFREVPFRTRVISMVSGARGFWVGEHKPIPLSKPAIDGSELLRTKIATIVVVTEEALEDSRLESQLQADMIRAVAEAVDEVFLDVDNAGIANSMPASITNGVPPIASSGDPIVDIQALIAAFRGDLNSAVFASDPITLSEIALWRDASGGFMFPDLGVRGGSILGIPVVSSRTSPRNSSGGQIALYDPTGIALAIDNIAVERAKNATIIMADNPEVVSSPRVSLFNTDSVALKVRLFVNWEAQREDGVAAIAGASYAAS